MKNSMTTKLASIPALFLACMAAGCGSPDKGYDERFAMLEDADASNADKCALVTDAAEWALDNRDREAFRKWTRLKEQTCAASSAPEKPVVEKGVIEGAYSYPSDYIPEDIEACVSNVDTNETICDSEREGNNFSIELPPGRYQLWSQTADMQGYRSYYSKAVPCGLGVECSDHTPIVIELESGERYRNADPADWYAGG